MSSRLGSSPAGAFARIVTLERLNEDLFRGAPSPDRGERTYGGQFLAQALAAAQATVGNACAVHSLHACFLRSGAAAELVEPSVERVRDGRSFSQRAVHARQSGREVLRMMFSFHVPEAGDDYAGVRMPDVPAPEAVETSYTDYTVTHLSGIP